MKPTTAAAAISVTLLALLTACSDDESTPSSTPSTSASTPDEPDEPSSPEPMTLKEACPEIEAALPSGFKLSEIIGFGDRLVELHAASDVEAQNAINFLGNATLDLRTALEGDASPAQVLAARGEYLDALDQVADRCRTVGSSALQ